MRESPEKTREKREEKEKATPREIGRNYKIYVWVVAGVTVSRCRLPDVRAHNIISHLLRAGRKATSPTWRGRLRIAGVGVEAGTGARSPQIAVVRESARVGCCLSLLRAGFRRLSQAS